MKRAACSWMAATTLGWQWPVDTTAMPAVKSRYSLPSTVVIQEPEPDTTFRSVTLNHTSERCELIARCYVAWVRAAVLVRPLRARSRGPRRRCRRDGRPSPHEPARARRRDRRRCDGAG